MRPPRRFTTSLATAALCGTLLAGGAVLAPASTAAPLSAATLSARTAFMGTWVGTYSGFEDGKPHVGLERFVITKMKGSVAVGTWAFRDTAKDAWSAAEPAQFIVLPAAGGGWQVTGADANGIYFGTMNAAGTKLDLTYQGSVNTLVTLRFLMTKK